MYSFFVFLRKLKLELFIMLFAFIMVIPVYGQDSEEPSITTFVMTREWPEKIYFNITFSTEMDTSTFVASDAVIFVDIPRGISQFNDVDYASWYVIQKKDNCEWSDDKKNLKITLCEEGRDWIANKLTDNLSKSLKFAQKSSANRMIKDSSGNKLQLYTIYSYFEIADNRETDPIIPFNIYSNPKPTINLASATLTLYFNDKALLFSDNYGTENELDPLIQMPTKNDINGSNNHLNNISLFNLGDNKSFTLSCESISTELNDWASSTVTVKLTDNDIKNILDFYNTSSTLNWAIQVNSNSFQNMWKTGNTQYKPTAPGTVHIIQPEPTKEASLIAVSVSDMPPTKDNTGNFTFEFELERAKAGNLTLPFSTLTQTTPKAAIFETSTGARIASATLDKWSTRTVRNKERAIATFKTSEEFSKEVDRVPAELRIYDLKDIFGNKAPEPLIASWVYDINQKSGSEITGFNTASEAFIIDNVAPTVMEFSPKLFGITKVGNDKFYVEYSEPMNPDVIPSLVIATDSSTLTFSFSKWEDSNQKAVFANSQAITPETINGTWTYILSGGQDVAGNSFVNYEDKVLIKSEVPRIVSNSMKLYSIRTNIDNNTVVVDKPLNLEASPEYTEISFKYVNENTENLPHKLCFYDNTNTQIGSATINQDGVYATATFSITDFNSLPTQNTYITLKVIDNANNLTDAIRDINYYAIPPEVTSMKIYGAATESNNIYYYSTTMNDLRFTANLNGQINNPLNLIIKPTNELATTTITTEYANGYTFETTFGPSLEENEYKIYLADEAGNLHTNAEPLSLVVDNTAPTIDNIIPGQEDLTANTKIGMATFTIKFNELMDTTVKPTLILATSTLNATIDMKFTGWGDDLMTASFTNAVNIVSTYPVGIYNYYVGEAKDLAGNEIWTTPATCTTVIHPQGPGVSTFTILTLQPDIDENTVFENRDYNPQKYNDGSDAASVTFKIGYSSGPFDAPHNLLIYNSNNENIATLPVSVGNPGYAIWQANDIPLGNNTYYFNIIDNLNNYGSEESYLSWTFKTDITNPVIEAINFDDGGIGQTYEGNRYYSPSVPATFSVTTDETSDLALIAFSLETTATNTYVIPASMSHTISFGNDLADGDVKLTLSDLAGNINDIHSMKLRVDSVPPQVNLLAAVDDMDSPQLMIGKKAKILVTFDKIMNTDIVPTVRIATNTSDTDTEYTDIATLTFSSWEGTQKCYFETNDVFDNIDFPVGTATLEVYGARDLAGNYIATTTTNFTEVISKDPVFEANLTTQQILLNDETLTNKPFSLKAEPNVATLTIKYNTENGPYATPHTLLLFDGTETEIANHNLTIENGIATLTINNLFFGDLAATIASPAEYSGSFTVKIKDSVNNTASDTNEFVINYDSISPKVTSITTTGISTASTDLIYYYNPDILNNLETRITLNASDALRLVVFGVASDASDVATRTYEMSSENNSSYSYNGNLNDNSDNGLLEGTYTLTAVDMAGNFAVLSDNTAITASATLLIDKTPPEVLLATITNQIYISSGEAGMATFSVKFNEQMFDKGYQHLEIATDTYKIVCNFIKLETSTIASDTAIFETAVAVQSTIPQGSYTYHIIGTDLTGNKIETDFGEILVRSGGPLISNIKTFSYQQTTASYTLESGNEYHYDEVFSFNVEPKAATMSFTLSEEPDGATTTVYLTFLKQTTINQQIKEIIVASYPLDIDENLMATFTWDSTKEPHVATSATYIIRIADINNDLSYRSYNWSVDNEKPAYSDISFTSGVNVPEEEIVYMNPYRHTNFEVVFKDIIDINPKLRVRSQISTDTYSLTPQSNNTWKVAFRGKYSRSNPDNPDDLMPDGIYDIGLVDQAGNLAASSTENLYKLVIDTKLPVVSTYTLKINNLKVDTYCAPSDAKPLIVSIETTEQLNATGAYYLDIYDTGGTRVNRINLVNNGGVIQASWDGKNSIGTTVADGTYTFKVSDFCGNTSEKDISITAITSPFHVMSPAVQTSYNTVKVWFNHSINPTSLGATPITSSPNIGLSNIHIEDERAIAFTANNLTHGASYTLTITTNLSNIYGSKIASNTAIFYADVRGPELIETSFEKVNNQNEIMLIFDQVLAKNKAEDINSYSITDQNGNLLTIQSAILQSDGYKVLISATDSFIENDVYIVKAFGVEDELGNKAVGKSLTGFNFKGRDITPPEFIISAFSNPANENDIIVVVASNEELLKIPTLTVIHGNASAITTEMQKNSINKLNFMAAVSLKASNGLSGSLKVDGEDLNGNKGNNTASFAIATVKPSSNIKLSSSDNKFSLIFNDDSLKTEATVKILQRAMIKDETATGTIKTLLQNEYASIRGVRASTTTFEEEVKNSELTPLTDAYEASINSSKVNKGIIASLKIPDTATQTTGLGLFYQKNNTWNFISSNITTEKEMKARILSNQVFAIMRDSVAPTIKLDESIDLTKDFETARPEFIGTIKDFGSGIDTNNIEAKIDNKYQSITLDDNGNFKIKSLSELINGNHNLTISAKDRTGNSASTGNMRFNLVLPFEFKQIIQYPNPARNNVNIRIRTNSTGINCNIRIKIYDVAGHKVADFYENDVIDKGDGNYEVRWDLRNKKGKKVANGAYIAKLEAINPETGKKVKSTLKIAILK